MKDNYDNAEKMARKGGKMLIYESQILRLTLYHTKNFTIHIKKVKTKIKMFLITHQHLRQVLPKDPGRDGICGYTIQTE